MAHFAKVNFNTKLVEQVIVADQEYVNTLPGIWVQTSYNTRGGVHYDPNTNLPSVDQSKALRKNYAGVGFVYDFSRDAFYLPQPYPSWILNENTCMWEPPVPYPADGNLEHRYEWDENIINWIPIN